MNFLKAPSDPETSQ